MLVLVVGPSGAGKDALLKAARAAFRDDPRIAFARRAITRPPDPDGEDHEPVTDDEFARHDFALSWSAHGLRYGIGSERIRAAPIVVANVSRAVIAEAAARFPVHVIEVSAPPEILAARLAARGRETADDVARRLTRVSTIPEGAPITLVRNDASLREGEERFIAALRALLDAAGPG